MVINDVTNGLAATHQQLLTDVLHVRNVLYDTLDQETRVKLWQGEDVFINLIAPATYEFGVGFLAILAVGGVVVPLSPVLPAQEALYFVRKSQAVAVLTASKCATLGRNIQEAVSGSQTPFVSLEPRPLIWNPLIPTSKMIISCDHFLDYHGSGVVIFPLRKHLLRRVL